jgi:hypothetical protein
VSVLLSQLWQDVACFYSIGISFVVEPPFCERSRKAEEVEGTV